MPSQRVKVTETVVYEIDVELPEEDALGDEEEIVDCAREQFMDLTLEQLMQAETSNAWEYEVLHG